MPGNLARPVRRGAVRKRTRELREPRRTAYPTDVGQCAAAEIADGRAGARPSRTAARCRGPGTWPVTTNRAEAPSGRPAVTTLNVTCNAGSYDGTPRTPSERRHTDECLVRIASWPQRPRSAVAPALRTRPGHTGTRARPRLSTPAIFTRCRRPPEDRLPPATRWPASHPVTPSAGPGMIHREEQSMRRRIKSTHIAEYLRLAPGPP